MRQTLAHSSRCNDLDTAASNPVQYCVATLPIGATGSAVPQVKKLDNLVGVGRCIML